MSSGDIEASQHLQTQPSSPRFARFDMDNVQTSDSHPLGAKVLIFLAYLFALITFPLTLARTVIVQPYQQLVVTRLGRVRWGNSQGQGLYFILPFVDTYFLIDMRTVSFSVKPQEILSKDSVTVKVDAVVYYKVKNAFIAVSNVEDYSGSTHLLAATTLRNVLGTKNLSELLSDRESISHKMQISLDEATEAWGIQVERVEIKDVQLPTQLQRAMAAEAEAHREARAKVVNAKGEQDASQALREAAEIIAKCPQALQLRYLQTLHHIAAEKSSTIVFPLPLEIFSAFLPQAQQNAPAAQSAQVQKQAAVTIDMSRDESS